MNTRLLSDDYYALAELQHRRSAIGIRTSSDDELVAMIDVLLPTIKASCADFGQFLEKVHALLKQRVNLLLLDLFPPSHDDPWGIHSAIWQRVERDAPVATFDKPLTCVAYETSDGVTAYMEPVAVGDTLQVMPVFIRPDVVVPLPLEETYQAAFAAFPQRWRAVLEAP